MVGSGATGATATRNHRLRAPSSSIEFPLDLAANVNDIASGLIFSIQLIYSVKFVISMLKSDCCLRLINALSPTYLSHDTAAQSPNPSNRHQDLG